MLNYFEMRTVDRKYDSAITHFWINNEECVERQNFFDLSKCAFFTEFFETGKYAFYPTTRAATILTETGLKSPPRIVAFLSEI